MRSGRVTSSSSQRRALWIGLGLLCVLFAVALWWSLRRPPSEGQPTSGAATTSEAPGTTQPPAGSVPTSADPLQPLLPDSNRTPGATLAVTAADICVPGYSRKVRNVPSSLKRAVYRSYGISNPPPRRYEVDHLISLELGGSNSQRNLWPESYQTEPWNAHTKDALENELHRRVCAGKLDLTTAQHEIATNWIAAYQKYVRSAQRPRTVP